RSKGKQALWTTGALCTGGGSWCCCVMSRWRRTRGCLGARHWAVARWWRQRPGVDGQSERRSATIERSGGSARRRELRGKPDGAKNGTEAVNGARRQRWAAVWDGAEQQWSGGAE
ncbi:hypothetical protein U1Q18_004352, partial [Sarracenia purpurea var. burkii]